MVLINLFKRISVSFGNSREQLGGPVDPIHAALASPYPLRDAGEEFLSLGLLTLLESTLRRDDQAFGVVDSVGGAGAVPGEVLAVGDFKTVEG